MSVIDAAHLFVRVVNNLKKSTINLHSPLEEFVIRKCGEDLAYIDNRKDAKQLYSFDFWDNLNIDWLKKQEIEKRILYSQSQ